MKNTTSETIGARACFFLAMVIAVLVWCSIQHARPPAASKHREPLSEFSAIRAMVYLGDIAKEPHPIASAENARVREYLINSIRALGMQVQTQSAVGLHSRGNGGAIGTVHNVIGRMPGTTPGKALLLMAHYDSVAKGAGAADDGASVAAILEVLRVLKMGPPLRNDVIVLFTDGEEVGLLGAEAFVSENPWAKDVGLALNFEYRGNGGPFLMFETTNDNGALVNGLSATSHPVANSLFYEIYKLLPNDTDMTVLKRYGIAGMNFAAIEGGSFYHTKLDSANGVSQESIQHSGEIMLDLAKHFGNISLNSIRAPNRVYFDFPGLGLVSYPVAWALPLLGIVVLAFATVITLGVRNGKVSIRRCIGATFLFLLVAILLAVIVQLTWSAISMMHPDYGAMVDPYNSQWYLLMFVALTIGCYIHILLGVRKWISHLEIACGAIGCWVLLLLAASVLVPGATYLLTWPLLPVLVVLAVLFSRYGNRILVNQRAALLLMAAVPALLIFSPLLRFIYIAVTARMISVVVLLLVLLLGIMTPMLSMLVRRHVLGLSLLATAGMFLVIASIASRFDADHPRPDNLFFAQDGNSGKAFWLSSDSRLDGWTKNFFPVNSVRKVVPEIFGDEDWKLWASSAPHIDAKAPSIKILEDRLGPEGRTLRLRIKSQRMAPELSVVIEDATVMNARVEGRSFTTTPQQNWYVNAFGFPSDGIRVDLTLKDSSRGKVRVTDRTEGLPGANVGERLPDSMNSAFGRGNTTQLVNTLVLRGVPESMANEEISALK